MKIGKSTETYMTELQWNKEGYILKPDAQGEDTWNNSFCRYTVRRYKQEEVIYNPNIAREIISTKRHEYYLTSKRKKEEEKKRIQWEEEHYPEHTAWQWLQQRKAPLAGEKPHKDDYNNFYYYFKCQVGPITEERFEELKALYIKKFGGWETIDLENTSYNGCVWW